MMGVMSLIIGWVFDCFGVKCLVILGMFLLIIGIILFVFIICNIVMVYIVVFYVVWMFGIVMVMMLVIIVGMNVFFVELMGYGIVVNNMMC